MVKARKAAEKLGQHHAKIQPPIPAPDNQQNTPNTHAYGSASYLFICKGEKRGRRKRNPSANGPIAAIPAAARPTIPSRGPSSPTAANRCHRRTHCRFMRRGAKGAKAAVSTAQHGPRAGSPKKNSSALPGGYNRTPAPLSPSLNPPFSPGACSPSHRPPDFPQTHPSSPSFLPWPPASPIRPWGPRTGASCSTTASGRCFGSASTPGPSTIQAASSRP